MLYIYTIASLNIKINLPYWTSLFSFCVRFGSPESSYGIRFWQSSLSLISWSIYCIHCHGSSQCIFCSVSTNWLGWSFAHFFLLVIMIIRLNLSGITHCLIDVILYNKKHQKSRIIEDRVKHLVTDQNIIN